MAWAYVCPSVPRRIYYEYESARGCLGGGVGNDSGCDCMRDGNNFIRRVLPAKEGGFR